MSRGLSPGRGRGGPGPIAKTLVGADSGPPPSARSDMSGGQSPGHGWSGQVELLDGVARDLPRAQLVAGDAVDQERAAAPEARQLLVGARRPRLRLRVRVEDGELVAVVLEEPDLGIDLELVAVRRREPVAATDVALGDAVAEDDQAAALVRRLLARVLAQLREHRLRDYLHSVRSIDSSTSSARQNSAERYFQPPSASTATTFAPSGSSSASRRATCTTAPAETPAKIPSCSRSAWTAATDSAFETSSLRSSCDTSRIGGT